MSDKSVLSFSRWYHAIRYRYRFCRVWWEIRRRLRRELAARNALYPQDEVKSLEEIVRELQWLLVLYYESRDGLVRDYFDMGLNYKGVNSDEYVFWCEWCWPRSLILQNAAEVVAILENKRACCRLLSQHGFPVPEDIGVMRLVDGLPVIVSQEGKVTPAAEVLRQRGMLFCKPMDELQGIGCFKLEAAAHGCMANGREWTWEQFCAQSILSQGRELQVEAVIRQHPRIAAFHPHSINTLRLWTRRDDATGKLVYWQGVFRIGAGGSCVDNAAQGGVCVGISDSGQLFEKGCSPHASASINIRRHPDSGEVFAGVHLPFFEEACALVARAHALFDSRNLLLAWDVAITPEGPVIIECNSNGDIMLQQRAHGGWRRVYEEVCIPEVKRIQAAQSQASSDRGACDNRISRTP